MPLQKRASTDTFEAMRHQEDTGYIFGDYLHEQQNNLPQNSHSVDTSCREKMIDWCYQIVDFCKFDCETVEIAISYLDRFLMTESAIGALSDRRIFQLAAMTALYTAIKVHEPEAMDPTLVSSLSRGAYSVQQVENMEMVILQAINWRVNPPTARSFVREFLDFLPSKALDATAKETVYDLCKLQIQLAAKDYRFIMVKSSAIALTSVMNAVESLCCDPSIYAFIGNTLAQASNIDWRSQEFQDAQNCLYTSVVNQPGFGGIATISSQSTKQSETKLSRCSSFEVSPRSATESV